MCCHRANDDEVICLVHFLPPVLVVLTAVSAAVYFVRWRSARPPSLLCVKHAPSSASSFVSSRGLAVRKDKLGWRRGSVRWRERQLF
jgi:hypothetical protein